MAEGDVKTVLSQLEEKMLSELKNNHPYEALQYVQSFVARKKKILGQNTTSLLVFHGAKLMIDYQATSSAGTLLCWFIEEGAGVDNVFKLQKNELDAENYCDVQRLTDLLSSLSVEQASPIVDVIYSPFHLLVAKAKVPEKGALAKRITKLEVVFANIFDGARRWLNAFKSFVRLDDIERSANVINKWSEDGLPTEKPLFFSRALLQLLADGKVAASARFLQFAAPLVGDNISTGSKGGGPTSAALAVWHLASTLTELAAMPPQPRVDKRKLFGLLYSRYTPLLLQIDTKLAELLVRIGEHVFGCQLTPVNPAPNPMAMLQGLLGGGAAGGPDLSQMMSMMGKMQR